jgi:hypothetical protein
MPPGYPPSMPVETDAFPPRYRDPQRIARGGMGEIYRATDSTLDRTVAVKLLATHFAADASVRKRFTREALAAARLSGEPNTVTIYDVGEWNDRPFIVMELLPGGSLEDVLRRDGLQPPEHALAWLEQAASALDAAHERGVVHRDVKPANLLLDREGNVHVADFGVASAAGLDALTLTGTVLGTAGYLAPEQAEGKATTAATDCYALGVVAFELLTGTRPFQNGSITAEATAHVHAPVPSASERASSVPPEVDPVLRRALAKSPGDRFSSCGELAAALRAAYDDDAGATRIASGRRRRSPAPLVLALVAAALGAVGIGVGAAVLATQHGGRAPAPAVIHTVTEPGTTVHDTVTAQAAPAPSGADLNAQAWAKMQAGDFQGALPLVQQAVQKLQASNSIDEAYADYNLAFTLAKLQGCSSQVLDLLDRSQAIQGHRPEINRLRKDCRKGGD